MIVPGRVHPLLDALISSGDAATSIGKEIQSGTPLHDPETIGRQLIDACGVDLFGLTAAQDADTISDRHAKASARNGARTRSEWRSTAINAFVNLPESAQHQVVDAIANGTGAHYASLLQQAGNQVIDSILTGMRAANANADKARLIPDNLIRT